MAEAKGFREQLAERLRNARLAVGHRQEDVADNMRLLGFPTWAKATVAGVELGRRGVTPDELYVLALIVEAPLMDLLDFDFVTPDGHIFGGEMRRASLTGEGMTPDRTWFVDYVKDWPDEAERKASGRLGIAVDDLRRLALRTWGCSLSEERDRRLGDTSDVPRRTTQALRGHITRELIAELAQGVGNRPTTKQEGKP